ncbi:ABC transporter substrate-binding protein [Candidatus Formimonas warabiya]|uniref:ABC transporter substrate-binding protein n=1 Tax=Formimonas warabiya TaxID=1761012 RepID=A0A3G1KYL2_FORW1|nr:ABC transporter substrate-binding protein [Candidatus Formimonas warabiya]ATW27603.1 ABC transporter substrate-binding protein [Candidatus Formimonas warabiya]
MKKLRVKLLLMMVLALVLVIGSTGCGSPQTQDEQGEVPAATEKEQAITVGTSFFPSNLDAAEEWNGWYTVEYGLGETPVKLNSAMELEPWVAESWQQVDENTWEIKIKDGVKFQNGKTVDAAAVKASFARTIAINPRAQELFNIDTMEATGNTLVVKTKTPNPAFMSSLVDPLAVVADAAAAEEMGDQFKTAPVLTGPFKAVKFEKDVEIAVERNEDYWGEKATLQRVVFKLIPDDNTRIMAMQSGDIDVVENVPVGSLDLFTQKDSYQVLSESGVRDHILVFNLAKPVFQDPAVRKAINTAIDRNALAHDLMKGMAVAGVGPFPLVTPFGGDKLTGYSYDAAAAAKLLDDAGWVLNSEGVRAKGSQKLDIVIKTYSSRPELPQIGQVLQSQLAQIGIKVSVEVVENIDESMSSGNFDAVIYSMNTAVTGDPQYFLNIFFKTGADSNYGKYSNPALDKVIEELGRTFETEKRYQLAQEAQQIILDDAAFVFLIYPKSNLVAKSNISGLSLHPSDFYFLNTQIEVN